MSGLFGTDVVRSLTKSVEWYTPPWVFEQLGITFDLDPCSPYDFDSFVPAETKWTIFDDGLAHEWFGRVWLNPPYAKSTPVWIQRLIAHGNGIAMVFSRTDAEWCQQALTAADAILFLAGRVEFVPGHENKHKTSRSGAGTVMFAFGEECAAALFNLRDRGFWIDKQEDMFSEVSA